MSISSTVDDLYRLQPTDLDGAPRRVVISNVTYQGIEEMTPVLHFEGQSKRLVLSAQQVSQLIELTGTSLFQQWRGRPIILLPLRTPRGSEIQIASPAVKRKAQGMPVGPRDDRKEWRRAVIFVSAIALLSAAYSALTWWGVLAQAQELLAPLLR